MKVNTVNQSPDLDQLNMSLDCESVKQLERERHEEGKLLDYQYIPSDQNRTPAADHLIKLLSKTYHNCCILTEYT